MLPLLWVLSHSSPPPPPPFLDDVEHVDGVDQEQPDNKPKSAADDAGAPPSAEDDHRGTQTFGDIVVLGVATGGVAVVSSLGALVVYALSAGALGLVLVVPLVATALTAGILAGGLDDVGVPGGIVAALASLLGGALGAVGFGVGGLFLVLAVNPRALSESQAGAVIGAFFGAGVGAAGAAMAAAAVAAVSAPMRGSASPVSPVFEE